MKSGKPLTLHTYDSAHSSDSQMAPNRKHFILVHGRSTKPSRADKTRLAHTALLHGLERVDLEAAAALREGRARFTLAYYGDINNRLLVEDDPDVAERLPLTDPESGDRPCEDPTPYEAPMRRHFARADFRASAYERFLDEVEDLRILDGRRLRAERGGLAVRHQRGSDSQALSRHVGLPE